eukprot:13592331-Alexandrium_andersonii.AAC.1
MRARHEPRNRSGLSGPSIRTASKSRSGSCRGADPRLPESSEAPGALLLLFFAQSLLGLQ